MATPLAERHFDPAAPQRQGIVEHRHVDLRAAAEDGARGYHQQAEKPLRAAASLGRATRALERGRSALRSVASLLSRSAQTLGTSCSRQGSRLASIPTCRLASAMLAKTYARLGAALAGAASES